MFDEGANNGGDDGDCSPISQQLWHHRAALLTRYKRPKATAAHKPLPKTYFQMSEHLVQIPVIGTNVCESLRAIVGGRGINGGKAIHTQETKVSGALMWSCCMALSSVGTITPPVCLFSSVSNSELCEQWCTSVVNTRALCVVWCGVVVCEPPRCTSSPLSA